jgi:hypothetical protein
MTELSPAAVKKSDEKRTDVIKDAAPQKRSFVSAGEKIHKWGTYFSVDFLLNATFGVLFWYGTEHTKLGQRLWSNPIKKGFTSLLEGSIKDAKSLEKSVDNGATFMSIIAGGMFTIPPLMALENTKNKKAIIKSLDEKIYGKDKVANDPKFQKAYDELGKEPKKGFWSGLLGRFAALAPLLWSVTNSKARPVTYKYYLDKFAWASEKCAQGLGFGRDLSIKEIAEIERFAKEAKKEPVLTEAQKRWKGIHNSIAMDVGFDWPYALMHMVTYTFFAKTFALLGIEKKQTPEGKPAPVHVKGPMHNAIGAEVEPEASRNEEAAPAKKEIPTTAIRHPEGHEKHQHAHAHAQQHHASMRG